MGQNNDLPESEKFLHKENKSKYFKKRGRGEAFQVGGK